MWLCSCLWSSKAPAFLAAFLACAGLSLRRQGAHLPPERRFLPPEGRLYPYPMLEELCHDRKPTSTYSSFTPRSSTPLFYFTLWFKAARYVRCCCCVGSDLLQLRQALSALQGIVEEEVRKAEAEENRQIGMASMDEKGPELASKKLFVVAVRPPSELSDSPTLTRFPHPSVRRHFGSSLSLAHLRVMSGSCSYYAKIALTTRLLCR